MELNRKDPMQTEDKESVRQCKITFHTKDKRILYCNHQSRTDFLDMAPSVIQNSASLSFRQIQQTKFFILP